MAQLSTGGGSKVTLALPPGRLVVANHLSWLDIFAIDALCPASFVAKSEIARWPLVGTLVARAGTLFIERGRRHAVHRLIEHIERSLQAGGRVAVFPEGTTGAGHALLPFHANLIQAAVDAQAPVVPVLVPAVAELKSWLCGMTSRATFALDQISRADAEELYS